MSAQLKRAPRWTDCRTAAQSTGRSGIVSSACHGALASDLPDTRGSGDLPESLGY